jgi:hypothetical protein
MTGVASLRDLVVPPGRGGSERLLGGLLHQGEDHRGDEADGEE